jgi:hypothetical protein
LPRSKPKQKQKQKHYEWRVEYRRRRWQKMQSRLFQSEPPARRFAVKLVRPTGRWRLLEPIVEVRVRHREVGPWDGEALLLDVDDSERTA